MIKVTLFLAVVILIIMIPAVTAIWQNAQRSIMEQAHTRAKTIYEMIVITRQWVAENRDRIEPVPAVATKELSQYADVMTSFKFHISSDKLTNPENAPTDFEVTAMEHLRLGAEEFFKVCKDEELGNVYNYAAPLLINESCLDCHAMQDYRVDDFRGVISISFPMNDIEESFEQSNSFMLYVMIISLILVVATVCFLIYLLITRHLLVLTNAAKNIELGIVSNTDIKTSDEIQDLSEAFDSMSLKIITNEEILKAKLDEAVEKYKNLVGELDDKNKKLNSLNQLKTDLLDSVAHEIRTPLTKILSYSELLSDVRLLENDEMRDKFASSMKHNINSIRMMFNDIITISRLEHDQYVYQKIPVKIYDMVEETVNSFELDIASKNIAVDISIDKDAILYVDGETFSIVINNIISNAIKYSYDNGNIEIVGYRTDNDYVLTCRDRGAGVPQEAINEVFKRFYRAVNVKKSYAGTGLGLSITARIIKDHKGSIDIQSEENKYTKVIIKLPLSSVDNPED